MKIIFIGGRSIHDIGGIETYMRNLATELVKLGHTPVVYCESDVNREEWFNGFLVIHQKSFKSNFVCKPLLGLKATIHSLRRFQDAEVYHYNTWAPSIGSWIPKLFGKKVLIQWHGLEWKRTKYSAAQRRVIKFIERVTVLFNKNIISVSQEQSDFIFHKYGRKCVTIPCAVNLPEIENAAM